MKLLIKLVIAAAIANAAWRVGSAYATHYRFKDAVQETTQFRGSRTDAEVRQRILDLAAQYDIPITDDTLSLEHTELNHTIVDASYTRPLLLLPGYTREWPFTLHVDTFVAQAAPPEPSRAP